MDPKQRAGIDATNHEYARYDQVVKPHTYHLAEAEHAEAYDEDYVVRTCDMAAWWNGGPQAKREFACELNQALSEIGFAVLVNHGTDPELYARAARDIPPMFAGTGLEDRMRFRAERCGSVNQGYFPIRETSDIHPDLVEGWVFCRRAFDLDGDPGYDAAGFWPLPELEPGFRELVGAHEKLIIPVMQAILTGLGCDPHLYDARLTRTNFGLRLNYYPPLSDEDRASGAARLLGHEDVDLFTLLPAPEVEGLQVFNQATQAWVRLNPPAGSIILNTGDYMQRITNDRLPSTTHRVSPPRNGTRDTRVSFPMAVYVWEDEILEVLPGLGEPKYPPIKAITFHTRTTSKFYGDDYAVES